MEESTSYGRFLPDACYVSKQCFFFLFIILQDIVDKLYAINRIHMFQTISEYVGGHDIWRMENCSSKDYP